MGNKVDNRLCEHFSLSRQELFQVASLPKDDLKVSKACFTLRRLFEAPYPTSIARLKSCW